MGILTDRLHKSGFALQAAVLRHMFHMVQRGEVEAPLFDTSKISHADNRSFLMEHVAQLITTAFPNLTMDQTTAFVTGLFNVNLNPDQFRQHLRDFLIQIKEFGEGSDNSELFLEEREAQQAASNKALWEYQASVPGLIKPSDLEDDPDL